MSFLRWIRTAISPAEPCATVSQYSSTTSTHSSTPDANTNEISPDQCSAKLDSPRSIDNQDVADSEQHISKDITDQPASEPKRVQSPNFQLMNREYITRNDPIRVPKTTTLLFMTNLAALYWQESKKVVMTAMLSGVRRDIIVANLQGFEEEMKYYRAINMTKKDVEEQSREFSEFAKMTFYSRQTMKSVEKRLGGTSERKVAIRNYFYSQPDYLKKNEFNRKFARCFILGQKEREVCRALNAEIIARRIKYDNPCDRQRISGDPELLSRDIILALKVLKSRKTIKTPRCTLSFMRCFGVSMMPCGLLGRCNGGEIRTESSVFTDESSNKSTLSVTMDEPAIDTSHALSFIEPFTRAKSTTIDSDSDGEILTIAKPISQKRQSIIKETPVGKKAEKRYELRRKRILARNKIEKEGANRRESGSESENEGVIVVEDKRVIKTKDGSGDEDENESVIKIEDDRGGQKERPIKIEDDSEREKEIHNKIEGECDDSESSVDEDLYKAKLELLSKVSNELGLLNSKKRKTILVANESKQSDLDRKLGGRC
ncbi:uncharacterized protein EAE97_011118 [Botrytis byssoidea]|uniref:Uncharacterized protein n=1 Tax=Botrytis byssoidea TaxID=139641 RepID=A0A9P5HXN0_9HELO|nr:uncharacterized protein EAE97_011118 [Botrytis byssoidea]KAF7922376.1 hypothetical protein EAE97_011118 [Botrytis byssoidea]